MKLIDFLAYCFGGDPFNSHEKLKNEIDMHLDDFRVRMEFIIKDHLENHFWNSYQTHGNGD